MSRGAAAIALALVVACGADPPPSHPVPTPIPPLTASSGASPSTPATARPSSPGTPIPRFLSVVPVANRWTANPSLTLAELRGALIGTSSRFERVFVAPGLLGGVTRALGLAGAAPTVETADVSTIVETLDARPRALGLIAAAAVGPRVLAAELDGRTLYGEARIADAASWPLRIESPADAAPDPSLTERWTLAAGGDVMLDRSIYRRTIVDGHGADYPWQGGTATLDGTVCCSAVGLPLPHARATGHAGAFAGLLRGADLSLVNLEGPVPDTSTYHPHGLVFTFDKRLLAGLANAGIDVVGLANNHIGDAGRDGVLETIANLDRAQLAHVGAGATAHVARAPLETTLPGGVRLALLAYDERRPEYWATGHAPGSNGFDLDRAVADVRAARAAGSTAIVFLHWGEEYRLAPRTWQRNAARALAAAGAVLVLGSHPHVTGPLDVVGDTVVAYSLGDLVFDLNRSEETMEGVVLEVTFDGDRVVQVRPRPTVILDLSQPNLLEPDGGAAVVLDRMKTAGD